VQVAGSPVDEEALAILRRLGVIATPSVPLS
jgi:hypothetical protein